MALTKVTYAMIEGAQVNVQDFGAVGDGTTDNTSAIQAAIDSAAANGGGCIYFPTGNYKLTGTLTISTDGISLVGENIKSTKLTFANGSNDCILLQHSSQINGIYISSMNLIGSSKTGGNMINAQIVAYLDIENVIIDNPYNGVLFYQTNTCTMRNVVITGPTGAYACKWDSPTTNNSSSLTLYQCVFQGLYLGADGFIWDGWATTLKMFSCSILSFNYGIKIINSRNSTTAYPSYGYCFDLEIDGVQSQALRIEAGFDFKFIGCDITNTSGATGQGNADTQCVYIDPDDTKSYTRLIQFVGSQIGNSRRQGMYINAKQVSVTGCSVHDVSKQGVSLYSAIELGSFADNVQITGGNAGTIYGDALNCAHGVLITASAKNVSIVGTNVNGTNLSGIENLSSTPASIEIKGCNGFTTKTAGNATITAGNTSITVPHGLALINPISVTVSPQQSTSVGTTFYGTISGGNIIIGMSTAQAGNITFCWSASLENTD